MATSSSMAASPSSGGGRLPSTEIMVIRHGETEWNASHRYQGQTDVELNEVGRKQAAAVAERVSEETRISAVYSSDLKRALETAEIIASRYGDLEVIHDLGLGERHLGVLEGLVSREAAKSSCSLNLLPSCCPAPDVIQDLGLRERHLGVLEGLVSREAAKTVPEAHEALKSRDRTDIEIPGGGESLDRLYKRCTTSFQRIVNKHSGERVVVVTHGGVIRALQEWASPHRKIKGEVPNASLSVFHLSAGNQWKVSEPEDWIQE